MQRSTFHKQGILDQIKNFLFYSHHHMYPYAQKSAQKPLILLRKLSRTHQFWHSECWRYAAHHVPHQTIRRALRIPKAGQESAGCGHQRHRVGVHGNLEGLWQVGNFRERCSIVEKHGERDGSQTMFCNNWSTQWCPMKLGLGAR